jgi:protein TonB
MRMPIKQPSVRLAARGASWEQLVGLTLVLAVHALVLYGLWTYRLLPTPVQVTTLFVNLINPAPPASPRNEVPPQPPTQVKLAKPRPLIKRKPRQLAVEAPVFTPSEPVVPEPPPQAESVIEAPPAPPPEPAGPVNLGEALAVVCPERTPPAYPAQARRLGEQGKVVLRVELDEQGRVTAARVHRSSGSTRLDEAALGAVRQWHCTPARRNGVAVRASALQPFNFILEGN